MLKCSKNLTLISFLILNLLYAPSTFAYQKRKTKLSSINNKKILNNCTKEPALPAVQDNYKRYKIFAVDSTSKSLKSTFFSKFRYSFGIGIVMASLKNNFQTNLQIDFYNKEDVHIGLILGYANKTTIWPKSNRTIAMINLQYDLLDAKKKNNIYFNIGAGVGYFSNAYTFSFMGEAPYDYFTFAPVGHVGFGYFRTISKNRGIFTEIGFGGPYFLNAGVFF